MNAPNVIPAIFSRFRDLNLITLIQNLRQGRVARGEWVREGRLCPLAHGLPNGQFVVGVSEEGFESLLGVDYAVDYALVRQFLTMWDSKLLSDVELLTELCILLRERRADADAVQGVLTAPVEVVAA